MRGTGYILAVVLLSSSCQGDSTNRSERSEVHSLEKGETATIKKKLSDYISIFKTMSGEDLIEALDPGPTSGGTLADLYLCACKNYLIERELASRGTQIKEDLTRHRQDRAMILTGISSPAGVVGDLCNYHLNQMKESDSATHSAGIRSGKLYLSLIASDNLMAPFLQEALRNGQASAPILDKRQIGSVTNH